MPTNHPPNAFHTLMIRMAVHDLRAPLSSILTGIDLALQPDLSPEDSDRVLRLCLDSGGKLMRQIESMLDIAYMQEGRLLARTAHHLLRPIAEEAIGLLHNSIQASNLIVEIHGPADAPPGLIDRDLTHRILINLLDNAIHHSPAGQRIVIEITPTDDTAISVRVTDDGAGIPPERRNSLFEQDTPDPFGPTARKRRGYGIGLVFCKLAAEVQGGSIRVEDAPPGLRGASFVVTLPAA
jgi:two-component system, sensor histidine kinase and response regulator